jgi:hypothetical protein
VEIAGVNFGTSVQPELLTVSLRKRCVNYKSQHNTEIAMPRARFSFRVFMLKLPVLHRAANVIDLLTLSKQDTELMNITSGCVCNYHCVIKIHINFCL